MYNSNVIGYRLVHAAAKIMAQTRRRYTEYCFFSNVEYEPTGRVDIIYRLNIFGMDFAIPFFNKINYDYYDTVSEESELRVGDNVILPISLVKTYVYEYERKEVVYNEEEAREFIEQILDERLRISLHGLRFENPEKNFFVDELGVLGVFEMIVTEDICEEREIETEIIE